MQRSLPRLSIWKGLLKSYPFASPHEYMCILKLISTEKYPDENRYNTFLSSHNGNSNAFTSMTDTNYYFDVSPNHLHEALDLFAQFFISPLFTASATDREINAVDAENAKNLQNDHWRKNQLYKSFADPEHVYHKFGTGNKQTLKETPAEKGINVREQLLSFHKKYYSASIMCLVIYGHEDVDTLVTMATELFSGINNNGRDFPLFKGVPYREDHLGYMVNMIPVKDLRVLEVTWLFPSVSKLCLSKPSRYLSHLIGHEGPGSLLSYLKSRKWANELSAGLSIDEPNWSVFTISVDATELGIQDHVDDILQAIYQYCAMLQRHEKVEEWVFQEAQKVEAINFRFKNKETPIHYACELAGNMQKFCNLEGLEEKQTYIVSGRHLLYEYKPDKIKKLLGCLRPDNMRVLVIRKPNASIPDSAWKYEKWYNTAFVETKMNEEYLSQLTQRDSNQSVFHLPVPNEFIASNFDLICQVKKKEIVEPSLVFEDNMSRVWYKLDDYFLQPKMNFFMNIISPSVYGGHSSPFCSVATDLLIRFVKDSLTELVYDADLAGMKYLLSYSKKGIELYLSGFSDKLPVLLHVILDKIMALTSLDVRNEAHRDNFDRVVKKVELSYKNFEQEQPYQHAMYNGSYSVEETKWHISSAKLSLIQSYPFGLSDLVQHAKQIFNHFFLEVLAHGNITQEKSCKIVSEVLQKLSTGPEVGATQTIPLQANQFYLTASRVVNLNPCKSYRHEVNGPNPDNTNSAIQILFQLGNSTTNNRLRLRCFSALLAHLLKEPCFNQLRTLEQLGYLVFSGSLMVENVLYIRFIVQSQEVSPQRLDQRIEHFITLFQEILEKMSPETFQENVDALCNKLMEKPKTPWALATEYWSAISNRQYWFNRKKDMVSFFESCNGGCLQQDLMHFFNEFISDGGSKRAKLATLVYGNQFALPIAASNEESQEDINVVNALSAMIFEDETKHSELCLIKNMDTFKQQMPLFPYFGHINPPNSKL